MSNGNITQFFMRSLVLLSSIVIVSISMFSAPILSSMMYSTSSSSSQSIFLLANAQNGTDSGESYKSDSSSSSPLPTDSTSSTSIDPSLVSPSTATDTSSIENPVTLPENGENSSFSPSNGDNGDRDLDCDDISDRNFIGSSQDPNGLDGNDNDGIVCESNGGNNSNGNLTASPENDNESPDGDCLFDPNLPKCASVDGECPDGFFQNGYEQCVPDHRDGCPDGYHSVDDDETGRCIPNSDGCPEGMIFRSNGKTCGYKEGLCKGDPSLEGCVETPQECDNGRDDDGDGLTDSKDPDCGLQQCDPSYPDNCIPSPPPDLDCDQDGDVKGDEIPYHNFKVNKPDPHGFDGNDNDGIGCEINDNGDDDGDGNNGDSDVIRASQDTCDDISDTINLFPGQLDSERVQIIAFFEDCALDLASLTLNIPEDDDLKLVGANFEKGVSDAVEVELVPIDNQESNLDNSLYEATISGTQEGLDLETGDSKTINNVNGIVLWNNGDDPIQFAENNSIEFDIEFD
jgi:hypothetical protein